VRSKFLSLTGFKKSGRRALKIFRIRISRATYRVSQCDINTSRRLPRRCGVKLYSGSLVKCFLYLPQAGL